MKILFFLIVLLHGAIHLLGFLKAFHPSAVTQLTQPISRISGSFWLITSLTFIISAGLFLFKNNSWWIFASSAIIISQVLIMRNWHDAKFGTAANIIILIPVIISLINSLPSSYRNIYKSEVIKRLHPLTETAIVTEQSIITLPDPVKKYLRYTGSIGKPVVKNFRVNFEGSMRRDLSAKWSNISSKQYNFFDNPSRLFYIKSSMMGIPFDGLHSYTGNNAIMQIKVASLFQVVDARGEKMNQSENVTLLNDMCLFAPATLIDEKIKWEAIDSLSSRAAFTHNGITITATLYFNEKGELVNFVSDDRYLSADGKTYTRYRWSTPVKEYIEINDRKLTAYAEATWSMPEGEFTYARFRLKEVEYNCTEYKD